MERARPSSATLHHRHAVSVWRAMGQACGWRTYAFPMLHVRVGVVTEMTFGHTFPQRNGQAPELSDKYAVVGALKTSHERVALQVYMEYTCNLEAPTFLAHL